MSLGSEAVRMKEEPVWESETAARAGLEEPESTSSAWDGHVKYEIKVEREASDLYIDFEVEKPERETGDRVGHLNREMREESKSGSEGECVLSETSVTGLYIDHTVKEELVLGPEQVHRPKVALAPRCIQPQYRRKQRNIKSSMDERLYKCQYCSYASDNKDTIKNHEKIHISDKPFKCAHCSFSTAYRNSLYVHTKTYTGEKPYKCSYCSYSTVYKTNLNVHLKTHTGDKPYKCDHCSFSSAQKIALQVHVRTHSGEKPYKCAHCTYSSARKGDLHVHLRTHTGDKPYTCDYCSYSSARKYNFKVHVRTCKWNF